MLNKNLKVALIHDWITGMRGGERVLEAFLEIFPNADIYTSVYKKEMAKFFPENKVQTSFLQKIPGAGKHYTKMLFFMPKAFESFDLSEYDLVLSSSSSVAKGVITGPDTLHISYIHSPMRYAWDLYFQYRKNSGMITKFFMELFMPGIRVWDVINTNRIDYLISNSKYVKKRIEKYYRRDAEVINPPVDIERLTPNWKEPEDYYLILSSFVDYKRIDLAIETFNKNGKKLLIIGDGAERKKLEALKQNDNIKFLGRLADKEAKEYLQKCKAFIFCALEDFGIAPLEAQACGRPVIAFGKGGVLETVVDGVTGIHFKEQTVDSLFEAINRFETMRFDIKEIREHSEKFSKQRFIEEISSFIEEKYKIFNNKKE